MPIQIDLTPREVELTHSKLLEVAQGIGFMRDKLSPPQWEITQKIGMIYRAIRDFVEDIDSHRGVLLRDHAIKKDGEIVHNEDGSFLLRQPDHRIAESEFLRLPVKVTLPVWHWSELAWLHGCQVNDVSVESIVISPLTHIILEN